MLDPILGILANFESLDDLKRRIGDLFRVLCVFVLGGGGGGGGGEGCAGFAFLCVFALL